MGTERKERHMAGAPEFSLSLVVKHSHHMHSSPASLLISRFSEQFIYFFVKEREKDQLMPSLLWCCSFRCIQRAIECEMRIGREIVEVFYLSGNFEKKKDIPARQSSSLIFATGQNITIELFFEKKKT